MIYIDKAFIISNAYALINPFRDEWKNNNSTNCYAYALGLDVATNHMEFSTDRIIYNPGYFGGKMLNSPFTKEELLISILMDTDRLDLYSYSVNPSYKLMDGEWKIALFGAITDEKNMFKDFHFLRQTKNGIWTHKLGFASAPIDIDSNNEKIISPTDCKLEYKDDNQIYKYKYIKTLCLKK